MAKLIQNYIIDTKDGKVKLFSNKCIKCKHYSFCYLDHRGNHHKGVPNGLCQECLDEEGLE